MLHSYQLGTLIEISRATSTVEMALSVLMDKRKNREDTFVKKFGVPMDQGTTT